MNLGLHFKTKKPFKWVTLTRPIIGMVRHGAHKEFTLQCGHTQFFTRAMLDDIDPDVEEMDIGTEVVCPYCSRSATPGRNPRR